MSSRLPTHVRRLIVGSRCRRCLSCGCAWMAETRAGLPTLRLLAAAAVFAGAWTAAPIVTLAWRIHRGGPLPAGSGAGSSAASSGAGAAERKRGGTIWDALRAAWDERAGGPAGGAAGSSRASGITIENPSGGADISSVIRMLIRSHSAGELHQIDQMDKRQLWQQYGHYFQSKQQAQQAYDEYKKQRASPSP